MGMEIKTAVIGVGYLGRFHAQKYQILEGSSLQGVVDLNPARAKEVGEELGVPYYSKIEDILDQVDAVSISTSTPTHFAVASQCLNAGKHILIEKPICSTAEEAEVLVELAGRKKVLMQVGLLERFNPAFLACRERMVKPQFIEAIGGHAL